MDQYTLTDEATVARIADTAPRALPAYFLCLHKADADGKCSFSRDEIIHNRMRSWTKFRNDIRTLAFMFLLNFLEGDQEIEIEIIPQEGI